MHETEASLPPMADGEPSSGQSDGDSPSRATPAAVSPPQYSQLAAPDSGASSSSIGAATTTTSGDERHGVLQFDIVPPSDASSFQAGYQGLQPRGFDVWLRGDVLIKHAQASQAPQDSSSAMQQARFSQCTIELLATESVKTRGRPVVHQLYHSSATLWTSPSVPGPSSREQESAATSTSSTEMARPPAVMPFQFPLPEDLPHCVHLPDIKIEYRLVATLHPMQDDPDQEPLHREVIVHLTRYTPPNPIKELIPASLIRRFSDEPKDWSLVSPTKVEIRLARTLFRRAEPIRIRVRIPPPDEALVDKGLRVRSVEAELVRVVEPRVTDANNKGKESSSGDSSSGIRDQGQASSTPVLHHNATADGWEPHHHLLYRDEQPDTVAAAPPEQSSSGAAAMLVNAMQANSATSLGAADQDDYPRTSSTVLAHSGKSCRFSMRKPLVLHLMLVPPFSTPTLPHPSPDHDAPPSGLSPLTAGTSGGGGGCESISQQTELSSVRFIVSIRVRMRGRSNEPAATTTTMTTMSSSQIRSGSADTQHDVNVEQEVFVLPGLAGELGGASTSGNTDLTTENMQSPIPMDEEEFDGYEDFRDEHDAYADIVSHVPTLAISSPDHADVSGHSSAAAAAAFTTVRRREAQNDEDDELPPNVEESQNDLQIFPGGEGDGGEGEMSGGQGVDGGQGDSSGDGVNIGAAGPPPTWLSSTQGNASSPVIIEGVGTGVRRHGGSANQVHPASSLWMSAGLIDRSSSSSSPPPGFEAAAAEHDDDEEMSTRSTAGYAFTPPPPPPQLLTLGHTPTASRRSFDGANGSTGGGVSSGGNLLPPPYMQPSGEASSSSSTDSGEGPATLANASSSSSSSSSAAATAESLEHRSASSEKAALAAAYDSADEEHGGEAFSTPTLSATRLEEGGADQAMTPVLAAASGPAPPTTATAAEAATSAPPPATLPLAAIASNMHHAHVHSRSHGLPPAYYAEMPPPLTPPPATSASVARGGGGSGSNDMARTIADGQIDSDRRHSSPPSSPPPPISPLPLDDDGNGEERVELVMERPGRQVGIASVRRNGNGSAIHIDDDELPLYEE